MTVASVGARPWSSSHSLAATGYGSSPKSSLAGMLATPMTATITARAPAALPNSRRSTRGLPRSPYGGAGQGHDGGDRQVPADRSAAAVKTTNGTVARHVGRRAIATTAATTTRMNASWPRSSKVGGCHSRDPGEHLAPLDGHPAGTRAAWARTG